MFVHCRKPSEYILENIDLSDLGTFHIVGYYDELRLIKLDLW